MPRLAPWLLGGILAAAALAWLAGFIWFMGDARRPLPLPAQADGIVALTGGSDRIATGLALLRQGRGTKLLISGVGPYFDLSAVLRATGGDPAAGTSASLAARITLGRTATDTQGNAAEAAAWARDNHLRALIIVTAGYHMRRALADIAAALPDATLYPAPVVPPALRMATGPFQLRLLAAEYTKYLITLCLVRLVPPAPSHAAYRGTQEGIAHAGLPRAWMAA